MALKFYCQDGYDLVGSTLAECTSTGEWNHPFPACVPWPCESPPIPPNSQIQSTVIRPDIITAIVRCDPGFRLLGSNLTCGPAGIWKGKAECEAQLCPLPKQLSTGKAVIGDFKFTQPLKSSYGFGETIQFSCRLGYVLEDPQMSALTCADDGQWDEQKIPVCQPIRCPDVQVPKHGTVSGTSSILDSRITFSCQEGYQLNGEEQITCRPDGTWSHPAMPVCVTRSCGDPPNIDNGFAVVRGTGVGDTISYSYETGHRLSGTQMK
jgi:CUB/sushi domain-containing protein